MRQFMLLGAALLCVAVPAFAAPPTASAASAKPASNDTTVPAKALELAQLLNPTEEMVDVAGKSFDHAFDKAMAEDGGAGELENDHPGFVAALRTAAREATLADLRSDMPAIHRRYARFFSATFTPEEVAELIAFYQSPTGAKIVHAKFANIDIAGMVNRFAANPDAKFSANDIEAVNDSAMPALWQGMNAEDFRTLMTFATRPVARKLGEAAPRMAEIEAEIANEPDPGLDAAIDAATAKVYERYGMEQGSGDR